MFDPGEVVWMDRWMVPRYKSLDFSFTACRLLKNKETTVSMWGKVWGRGRLQQHRFKPPVNG